MSLLQIHTLFFFSKDWESCLVPKDKTSTTYILNSLPKKVHCVCIRCNCINATRVLSTSLSLELTMQKQLKHLCILQFVLVVTDFPFPTNTQSLPQESCLIQCTKRQACSVFRVFNHGLSFWLNSTFHSRKIALECYLMLLIQKIIWEALTDIRYRHI